MLSINESLVYEILREAYRWSFDYYLRPFRDLDSRIKRTIQEHFWEKRLGIKTAGISPIQEDTTRFKDSIVYVPTPYHVIEGILDRLKFGDDDVFIDLGCGKGRVVLFVAAKKLKKVIGIEARKDMFDIAMKNLEKSQVKNTPVEIVNADVATFDMREGTTFFMYQPFGINTLKCVMENIRNSLTVNPRQVLIICYGNINLGDISDYDKWLEHRNTFKSISVNIWRSK